MKKIIFLTLLFTTVIYSQKKFKDQPLVSEIFTADPSSHIFKKIHQLMIVVENTL